MAGVLRQRRGTVGVEPGQGRVQAVGKHHQRCGAGLAQFGGAHGKVGGAVAADAAVHSQVEHGRTGLQDRRGECDVTEVPTVLARPPGQRVCVGLDRSEVLRGPRCGVEQVQLAGAGAIVRVGAGLGEYGERAAVRSLPQFHDVPVPEHVRGGDVAGAQVEQAQPGTGFALTDDNGVVAVLDAARVLLGGLVLGQQSNQVGIGERQVIDDASTPAGQRDHHVIRASKPLQLRGTTLGAVGQEAQRARVRGPARPGLRRGVGGRPAPHTVAFDVGEPECGVQVITDLAGGGENVTEQMPVRSKSWGLRDATIDHEFGDQTCHAVSLPTSTVNRPPSPARPPARAFG